MVSRFGSGVASADRLARIRQGTFRAGVSGNQIRYAKTQTTEAIQERQRQARISREVQEFNQGVSYENYKEKYNRLSPDAKKMVKSPEEVFASAGYKQYQSARIEQAARAQAQEWINRKIQGKRIARSTQYEKDPYALAVLSRANRIYERYLAENPDVVDAMYAGSRARVESEAAGFKSPEEYFAVQKQLDVIKPITVTQTTTQPEVLGKEEIWTEERRVGSGWEEPKKVNLLSQITRLDAVGSNWMKNQQQSNLQLLTDIKNTPGLNITNPKVLERVEDFEKTGNLLGSGATTIEKQVLQKPFSTLALVGGAYAFTPGITSITLSSALGDWKKKGQQSDKFLIRAASELAPVTAGDIFLTSAFIGSYKYIPPVGKTALSGYISYEGIKGALNPELTPEQRTASGFIGVLGGIGAISQIYPFVKGTIARFRPSTKPVTTEIYGSTTYKAIKNIQGDKTFDIALIPEGTRGSRGPAFTRGAYGFSTAEQQAYIGKTGTVTSSARNLFSLLKNNVKIKTTQDPKGFYATPFDLRTGTAQTRTSRLGLISWKDFFKFPSSGSRVILTRERPQIIAFENARITRSGGGGTFSAVGNPTSELEVTALGNILKVSKLGQTVLKGQQVDIYSARLGGGSSTPTQFVNMLKKGGVDTRSAFVDTTFTSPFSLGSLFSVNLRTSQPQGTASLTRTISPPVTTRTLYRITPNSSFSLPTTKTVSILPTKRYSFTPTIGISPSAPSRRPTVAPRKITITPSYNPRGGSSPYSPYSSPRRRPRSIFLGGRAKRRTRAKRFLVQQKRFGKFKNISFASSLKKAVEQGRTSTSKNISATFRIIPLSGSKTLGIKAPKGFYKKKGAKVPLTFVEKKQFRLSKQLEINQINLFKQRKSKKNFSVLSF